MITWWLIPLSKWVTTLVINGISGVSPLITGVITHLPSGMNHQVMTINGRRSCPAESHRSARWSIQVFVRLEKIPKLIHGIGSSKITP